MAKTDVPEQKRLSLLLRRVLVMAGTKKAKTKKWKASQDSLDRLSIALDLLQESLVGSLFDRAEMKKFELAFEHASDQIVITDRDGVILFANQALKKISGYAPQKVRGKKFDDKELWSGQMPQTFFDKIWHAVHETKTSFFGEVNNRRLNGEDYISEIHIAPVLDANEQVRYLVIIERDITEAKKLEQAKDNFLSIASHELKTPLTAIHWSMEMLRNKDFGQLNPQQNEFIQSIEQVTQRLTSLVKMLLNISRIDVGSVSIKPEPINLQDIIKDVLHELQGGIEDKRLSVRQHYPKKMRTIFLDKNLIFVAFTNLLSNAVKYNKKNGKISVSISALTGSYRIRISDTGIGIPKSQHELIFGKMFRADNARTLNIPGTGLGLYIAKWIIESADGSIDFTSTLGKGTTFVFTIPFKGMKARKGTRSLE